MNDNPLQKYLMSKAEFTFLAILIDDNKIFQKKIRRFCLGAHITYDGINLNITLHKKKIFMFGGTKTLSWVQSVVAKESTQPSYVSWQKALNLAESFYLTHNGSLVGSPYPGFLPKFNKTMSTDEFSISYVEGRDEQQKV